MNDLERRIKSYGDARWPDRDIKDKIRKLGEEFFELIEAAAKGDDSGLMLEAADMGILLIDLCALKGVSFEKAIRAKLTILEARRDWIEFLRRENIREELGG